MVIELKYYIAHYLNAFPAKGEVFMNLSPGAKVTGMSIDCKTHCGLEFGAYVQTHEDNAPRYNMQARSLGGFRSITWTFIWIIFHEPKCK